MSDTKDEYPPLSAADFPDFPPTDETGEVDLSLIDAMLELTPAQRLQRHIEFVEFADIQRQLRTKEYGFDPGEGTLEAIE